MRNIQNPRAIADRIRAATLSLTDPHDVEAVRQSLQELEDLARQQDAKVARRHTSKAPLDAHVRLPVGGDYAAETEMGGTVVPLSRTPIRGYLRKAAPSEGYTSKWVLTLDDPSQGP